MDNNSDYIKSDDITEFIKDINIYDEDKLFSILDNIKKENSQESFEREDFTINICKLCKSKNIMNDLEQGILVCTNCGYVLENLYDESAEWNNFGDDDDNKARCTSSTNYFMPQSSMSTTIGGHGAHMLKTLQNWNHMPYHERTLSIVFKEISAICIKYKILKCIEDDARVFYNNISKSKHLFGKNEGKCVIIRGKNRKSLIAACLYYACRKNGDTRSTKEIAEMFDLKCTDVTIGCKIFSKLIRLNQLRVNFNSNKPDKYLPRYCRILNIQGPFLQQCIDITNNSYKLNLASVHTPLSVAASSILIMASHNNINVTRRAVALAFDISDVTISKTHKRLEDYTKILVSNSLTNELYIKLTELKEQVPISNCLINKMIDIFDRKSQMISQDIYEQYNITYNKLIDSLNCDTLDYNNKLLIMESIIDIQKKKKEYIYNEYESIKLIN
jgi:transcription initiation factor TFIIIB Brf1 subunit/transcription initiation factor TFIIB